MELINFAFQSLVKLKNLLTINAKALQLAPEFPPIHIKLAVTYILLDRVKDARVSGVKSVELAPFAYESLVSKSSSVKNKAYLKIFLDAMRKAGFPE